MSATGAATLATITVDFNVLRRPAMLLHGLQGLDQAYTFYYDETNDHRLIRIRDDGLNVKPPQCFVLGGILHAGAPRALKVAELRSALGLEKEVEHPPQEGVLDWSSDIPIKKPSNTIAQTLTVKLFNGEVAVVVGEARGNFFETTDARDALILSPAPPPHDTK